MHPTPPTGLSKMRPARSPRLLPFILSLLLAFPAAALRPETIPPVGAAATDGAQLSAPSWDTERMAANKNKRAKNAKRKTVTTTVRQPVTQTFTNPGLIDVPSGGPDVKTARPYPALIEVAGFANGTILDVDLTLHGFTWDDGLEGFPRDADILVTAPHLGATALVLSDVGGHTAVTNLTLALDDEAAAPLPIESPLNSGAFQPTNADIGPVDTFPAPAPIPSGTSSLTVFDGANPNGTWQLFVVDDSQPLDPGSIRGGWSLTITAEADVPVQERVKKDKKDKKGKKRGKQGRR